jgi:type VI secretion system protein ImpA
MTDAAQDIAALPLVSTDDPCGADLDLAGDPDFMNFIAAVEGQLPTKSYYEFQRETIDFPTAFQTANKLLGRTHDIRLLVLLAKLSILNRDLEGFARWLRVTRSTLGTHWDEVHPRAEDGDFTARLVTLQSLDERPVVETPLQYAPLAETPRDGALTFRAQMVALGEARPHVESTVNAYGEAETGKEEKLPPAGAIERILKDAELASLVNAARSLQSIVDALASIRTLTVERVGLGQAVKFEAVDKLARRMAAFVTDAVRKRDPSFAPAPEPLAAGATGEPQLSQESAPVAFATLTDVDAALGAALGYFAAFEPSSPALLLIGQTRATLGKNLYDVMKLLAPAHADAARVFVGPDNAFTVPVSGLADAPSADFPRADAEPAPSRGAALALIDSVASHMRRVEPSSPAPYLLDRAKALASRDFLNLLQDVLPEDNLASMKNGR